jgi:hypothetical protein
MASRSREDVEGMTRKKRSKLMVAAVTVVGVLVVVYLQFVVLPAQYRQDRFDEILEKHLPPDPPEYPMKLAEREALRVEILQGPAEGVPRFVIRGEEIMPELGEGVPRLPPRPVVGKTGSQADLDAYLRARNRLWTRYVEPKLALVRRRMAELFRADPSLRGEIDAGPGVRHAYIIGVLDSFLEVAGNLGIEDPEITFVGQPPPSPPAKPR